MTINGIDDAKLELMVEKCRYSPSGLASILGISLRQLERVIKRQSNYTVHSYIFSIRMKHSLIYLKGSYKIAYVASLLGYRQLSHFCADFKKYYGLTPTQEILKTRVQCREFIMDDVIP